MPTATLNGIDVYYEEHGSGPAIILTHGLGQIAALGTPLATPLARRSRPRARGALRGNLEGAEGLSVGQ